MFSRVSDLSGISEGVMNCSSCNTRIDYRFLTNCDHCNCDIPNLPAADPIPGLALEYSAKTSLTWNRKLINLAYLFASSIAGMISGAVVVYFTAAITYALFFSDASLDPGTRCARGMAVASLSIVSGAFLGTMGGSVFAVKHPLCKGGNNR